MRVRRVLAVGLVVIAACSRRSDAPTPLPGAGSGSAASTATGTGAAASTAPTAPLTGDARIDAWRDDLRAIATEIPAKHKHAFFHVEESAWRASVADLDARLPQLDDAHVISGFARLVAALGDAHTMIDIVGQHGLYPLAFVWFDDGIFVVGASGDNSWAIGRKLVGISGHTVADLSAALAPLVSRDNAIGLHAHLPAMMSDPELLAGTDLVPADHATYKLAAADGTTRELDLKPGKGVGISLPQPLPLHLQGPSTNYWNKYLAPERLLYFAYNACAEDPRVGPFATFADSTLAFLDQHPVDRFVLDLRRNEGGNSTIIQPLLDGLAARPALAGHIFVIIGMHTFSSGVLAAMDFKRRLHATLVGGSTSGKPNAYGDVQVFELPHSKLHAQYSTKLFAFPDFPGESLDPDLPIKVTSADWFAGRDPAMDAIMAAPVPTAAPAPAPTK